MALLVIVLTFSLAVALNTIAKSAEHHRFAESCGFSRDVRFVWYVVFNHIPQILTNNTRITVHLSITNIVCRTHQHRQTVHENPLRRPTLNTNARTQVPEVRVCSKWPVSSVAYQTYNEIQNDPSFSNVDPVSEVESHSCFWRIREFWISSTLVKLTI